MSKIENKTLLITGGTGSFRNAVLKKFLKKGAINQTVKDCSQAK